MRRRPFALAVLLIAAGCDLLPGRAFDAEFPIVVLDPQFDIAMKAIPVRLYDASGLVASVQVLLPEGLQRPGPGVEVDPIDPKTVVLRWDGGSCLDRVRIALSTTGLGDFAIDVEEQGPLLGGCAGVGISRGVVITLNQDVTADQFALTIDPT